MWPSGRAVTQYTPSPLFSNSWGADHTVSCTWGYNSSVNYPPGGGAVNPKHKLGVVSHTQHSGGRGRRIRNSRLFLATQGFDVLLGHVRPCLFLYVLSVCFSRLPLLGRRYLIARDCLFHLFMVPSAWVVTLQSEVASQALPSPVRIYSKLLGHKKERNPLIVTLILFWLMP